MLKLGVSRKFITPSLDIPHAGWGAQTHIIGRGVEADFWTTALVLSNDTVLTVLIDIDTSHLSVALAGRIREEVAAAVHAKAAQVRVSTTHTHSAPMLSSEYYPQFAEQIAHYVDHLVQQSVAAAIDAASGLVPVTVGADYGSCSIASNRRQLLGNGRMVVGYNPDGVTDTTVGIVRFNNAKGEIVASIVHYACHPTILGFDNQWYSPEYPGVTKRMVEQHVGGICLFLQGAAGDQGPGPAGFKADLESMQQIGTRLGCEAIRVLLEIEAMQAMHRFDKVVESGAPLGIWNVDRPDQGTSLLDMRSVLVRLPLKAQLPVAEAQAIAHGYQQQLEQLQASQGTDEQIKEMTYKAKRAFFALGRSELYYGKEDMEAEIHIIRIGDVALIGTSVEPFLEIGLAIRQSSPFRFTLFSGYSNGWHGYLPNRSDYPLGGYEVEMTPFAPEAAEMLVHSVTEVLYQMEKGV